jgi:hypothetical protein
MSIRELNSLLQGLVLFREGEVHSAVSAAFFLDFADQGCADFSGAGQVGAAAGLQVCIFDFQQADAACASGGLD